MKYYGISLKTNINVQALMSFYHFNFNNTYKFIGERHNFWEIVYVKSGSVGITAETRIYELNANMLALHKPNEFHNIWSTKGTKPEVYVFSFVCEDEFLKDLEGKIVKLNNFEQQLIERIKTELENNTDCGEKSGKHIMSAKANIPKSSFQSVKSGLELLLSEIRNNYSVDKNVLTANLPVTHKDVFDNAIKFLKNNIYENILVEDICNEVNVSSTTLKRIFKKYTGESVKKYFLQLKIQKSKELLKQGLQIGTISETLGFSSQNYFCYAFKRETGQTPFLYKSKIKN